MSEAMCKGAWELGNACKKCPRCKETEAEFLRALVAEARIIFDRLLRDFNDLPEKLPQPERVKVWRMLTVAADYSNATKGI